MSRPATVLAKLRVRSRIRAAALHLLLSLIMAALAACLVFLIWYPDPYHLLSGGRELFLLVVTVDVVLGPLLTLAVFDRTKGWSHLRRDLTVIAVLQFAALVYGLHTAYSARPVALVFEVDRFRVVSAADVYEAELPLAPSPLDSLPWAGPRLLGVRSTKPEERLDAMSMAIEKGIDKSQRPKFWIPYAEVQSVALAKSRPLSDLLRQYPDQTDLVAERLRMVDVDGKEARWLPVRARRDWVALMRPDGTVATFAELDGFF